MASDIEIGGFAECSGPIGLIDTAAPVASAPSVAAPVRPGEMLQIRLHGRIGPDAAISSAVVQRALETAGRYDRILIDLSTDGGDVDTAFNVYEILRSLPVPLAAVTDRCHSAGIIVFLAAALRIAKPEATFQIHPLSISRDDMAERLTIQSLRAAARDLELIHNRNLQLIAARTSFDKAWFASESETENLLGIDAALHTGIVHAVEGVAGPCSLDWPETAKRLASERSIYLPQALTSANFMEACRVSQFFPPDP